VERSRVPGKVVKKSWERRNIMMEGIKSQAEI
jgi:hypothetical protein